MCYTVLWQYDRVKCFKNMRIRQNQKTRSLTFKNFENFEQFDSKLESNWHWPKMVKNDHFLIKNEFQRPRFGGGSFWSQKACPFCRGGQIFIYGNRFRAGYSGAKAPASPEILANARIDFAFCFFSFFQLFYCFSSYVINRRLEIPVCIYRSEIQKVRQVAVFRFSCTILFLRVVWSRELVRWKALT